MSYMIEGGGSKTHSKCKRWLYRSPEESKKLLQLLTDVNVEYLVEQVKAGAQMLQVFESNAECLGPDMFAEFSLPFLRQIAEKVKRQLLSEGLEPVPMVSRT
jgi:uroporphyrinogen decarboxylase